MTTIRRAMMPRTSQWGRSVVRAVPHLPGCHGTGPDDNIVGAELTSGAGGAAGIVETTGARAADPSDFAPRTLTMRSTRGAARGGT